MCSVNTETHQSKTYKSERLDFLKWSMNWINNNSNYQDFLFDVFQLGTIFQTLGFNVKHFERNPNLQKDTLRNTDTNVTIEITCSTSGIRTVLTKNMAECKCSKVTENNNETGYIKAEDMNLVMPIFPVFSTEKTQVINGLIDKLVFLVENDVTNNFDEMVKCCKLHDETYLKEKTGKELSREKNKSSSYLLDSSERDNQLSRHLLFVKEYAEKARAVLAFKETNSPQHVLRVKRVSNILREPETPRQFIRSTAGTSSPHMPCKSTPRRLQTIKARTPIMSETFKQSVTPKMPPKSSNVVSKANARTPNTLQLKSLKSRLATPNRLSPASTGALKNNYKSLIPTIVVNKSTTPNSRINNKPMEVVAKVKPTARAEQMRRNVKYTGTTSKEPMR